eukprot:TRINITY_DN1915_c0_g1_i4.p1 TRINITY_DN1915_c0_g1~~TRINITY_DN1915_c0_g1_i4.p1  ORF type:complete len:259 (-),score=24.46 TRINITY_DN1915_c0_g1_i4:491-1267(-)
MYYARKSGQPKLDYPPLFESQNLSNTGILSFTLVEKTTDVFIETRKSSGNESTSTGVRPSGSFGSDQGKSISKSTFVCKSREEPSKPRAKQSDGQEIETLKEIRRASARDDVIQAEPVCCILGIFGSIFGKKPAGSQGRGKVLSSGGSTRNTSASNSQGSSRLASDHYRPIIRDSDDHNQIYIQTTTTTTPPAALQDVRIISSSTLRSPHNIQVSHLFHLALWFINSTHMFDIPTQQPTLTRERIRKLINNKKKSPKA